METADLKQELKENIIKFLNLTGTPAEIKDDTGFFGEAGLGLDSIDSLELIVMMDRQYGIKINDPKEGRKALVDINTMAAYIVEHREKK
ncbi:MAG: acyl carrier protein [Opitutaceae bacterium]|nr:acyl carrier protein [Cytophagales bacterium]